MYDIHTINEKIFEVEIVLLHTLVVKRNVGKGTPTKYLLVFVKLQKKISVAAERKICYNRIHEDIDCRRTGRRYGQAARRLS